jgi:hypothetical protein
MKKQGAQIGNDNAAKDHVTKSKLAMIGANATSVDMAGIGTNAFKINSGSSPSLVSPHLGATTPRKTEAPVSISTKDVGRNAFNKGPLLQKANLVTPEYGAEPILKSADPKLTQRVAVENIVREGMRVLSEKPGRYLGSAAAASLAGVPVALGSALALTPTIAAVSLVRGESVVKNVKDTWENSAAMGLFAGGIAAYAAAGPEMRQKLSNDPKISKYRKVWEQASQQEADELVGRKF